MAIRDDLIEALNNCVDRFNAGESLNTILQDYPQLAAQLRPMLEAGFLVKRGRFPSIEVEQARQNAAPQIQQAISNTFTGGFFGFSSGLLLIILIGSGLLIATLFAIVRQPDTPIAMTSRSVTTNVATMTQATAPSVATSSTEAQVIATITANPTAENAVTDNATQPATDSATTVATDTATEQNQNATDDGTVPDNATETGAITIIEGPVDAIDGNQITIYNFDITLDAADPRLGIIQIGDIMRVEGLANGAVVVVLAFDFTNVEVFVLDDIVWRDTGDCFNLPPAWAAAEGWRIRCEGTAPSTTNTGGEGLPPGCKLTGFGTGNIRVKCSGGGSSRRS